MILRYAFKNFYSFKEETVVDFTVGTHARGRHGVLEREEEATTNLVLGVFGPNASGKTNLLKPLGFLAWFALNSAQSKPGDPLLYEAFVFDPEMPKQPTTFELEFSYADRIYRYELELLGHRVLREALFRKKTRYSFLFERTWDDSLGDYHFKAQDIGSTASVPQRQNASWLSTALLQEHELAIGLRPFFESIDGNLGPEGRVTSHDAEFLNLMHAAAYYESAPDTMARAQALMVSFDLGLSGLELRRSKSLGPDGKEHEIVLPVALHHVAGQQYARLLMQESRGTQALFVLLRYLLPILDRGGIAYIDEFESGLHPHMVAAVLDLFFHPASNPKGAQLIASFHTDYLLRDKLHKYQIYLVEKDEFLGSQAYRLDTLKGIRHVDNLYDKYHAGAYGAIPQLP